MKRKTSRPRFGNRTFQNATAICCACLLAVYPAMAQEGQQAQSAVQETTTNNSDLEAPKIPNDQLDSLVAPVALYPDPLLAQTLAASTYPLEVIQLQQWLAKNPDLKGKALTDAVEKQNWDPSIQATAALPDVVKLLSDDITWTTDLGNAFLSQQSDVMDAVQRMRLKAQGKGTLQTSQQQVVKTEEVEGKSVVVVQQADPDVVYVPSYNPTVVYGEPAYPYPPVYYPPVGSYVAGAAISFGVGLAIGSAWNGGWGWGCGWGRNDVNVNVNNNFVNNYNRNNNIHNNGNNWQHNPQHRGGAPYPNRNTANKYGGNGRGGQNGNRPGQAGNRPGQAGNRPGQAGNRPGQAGNRPGQAGNRPGQGGAGERQRTGNGQAANRPNKGSTGNRQRPSNSQAGNRPSQGNRKPSTAGNRSPSHASSANRMGSHQVSRPSSGRSHNAFSSGGGSRSSAMSSHSRGSRSMGGGGGHRGGGGRRR